VPRRPGNHQRRPPEGQPGEPCLPAVCRRDPPGESVHHHGVQHRDREEDHVERSNDAEPGDERQREHVQERRVVVLREIDARRQRQYFFGRERVVAGDELLVKHPLVPHVHTGIAARITREMSRQVKRQRPREGKRCQYVAEDDGERGSNSSSHGAGDFVSHLRAAAS
jgi:hypothetical protein